MTAWRLSAHESEFQEKLWRANLCGNMIDEGAATEESVAHLLRENLKIDHLVPTNLLAL